MQGGFFRSSRREGLELPLADLGDVRGFQPLRSESELHYRFD
jgi:hypothetical protein